MKVPWWKIKEYKLKKRWDYLHSDKARNTMTCVKLENEINKVIKDHQGALDKMLANEITA